MFPVTLAGPRITLREFRADDASAVFSYASVPVVSAYLPWDAHADLDVTREFLAGVLAGARAEERSRYELAITMTTVAGEEDRLIGAARVSVQDLRHRRGTSVTYSLRTAGRRASAPRPPTSWSRSVSSS
jgi:RimJ/RimL family protein N-acetyltransferase